MTSRRDFLKIAGMGAFLVAGKNILPGLNQISASLDLTPRSESKKFEPQIQHGIEVFGLNEPLSSEQDIQILYKALDILFEDRNHVKIGNKPEQRKELLNPNERYLEVVVRRSAYDSFQKNQPSTGIDFSGWIQAHMDLSNRCMEKSKPAPTLRGVVKRIIVVDDKFAGTFWDETAYTQNRGGAFDSAWRTKFGSMVPIDVDTSWAIASNSTTNKSSANMWISKNENNQISVTRVNAVNKDMPSKFTFPSKSELLDRVNNVPIEMNLIHEWSHYLFSLPDEYTQDVYDFKHNGFDRYLWSTGSFAIPDFDPYLSYLAKRNISEKRRELGQKEFKDLPEKTVININNGNSTAVGGIEIRRVTLIDGSIYGKKEFPELPSKYQRGKTVELTSDLFQGEGNSLLITYTENNIKKPLFFPAACLNICAISGLKNANLEINFYDKNIDTTNRTQEVVPIDELELPKLMDTIKANGWNAYASMKVPGTSTVFVWYLSNRVDTYYG